MSSKNKVVSLSDTDITSERSVSRRSLLGTLGIGAGAAAAALVGGTSSASASDPEGRGRRCPYRDGDSGDTVRRACGRTDND